MKKNIQTRLSGENLGINGNGKPLRQEEVFIAYLVLTRGENGDTLKDILRRIAECAPMIRYKNKAMIRNVIEKMEHLKVIQMDDTPRGKVITGRSIEAEQESFEFHKKLLWFEEILESPNF
ncbi:hypothetical protein KAW43_00110 [Candidatus Parcubacteria bacterium]|nr:hypothetical protein [Candidatus Parcubacteria bacterium]